MHRFLKHFIGILTLSPMLHGAEVLLSKNNMAAFSMDPSEGFSVGNKVCFFHMGKNLGCGQIVKTTSKGAIAKLDGNFIVTKGDRVQKDGAGSGSGGTKVEEEPSLPPTGKVKNRFGAVVHVSSYFYYPGIFYERLFGDHVAIQLKPVLLSYVNRTEASYGFGGMLGIAYYLKPNFSGLWINVGGGTLLFASTYTLAVPEAGLTFGGYGTVGYRHQWTTKMSFGIGAGIQYFSDMSSTITQSGLEFTGLRPLLLLDFSLDF